VRTEILVIGGGVIGSSIAYFLARRGRHVLVVDRAGIATEPSASWASAGGIRRQGRHKAEVQLSIEASIRWPTLGEELGADLDYRQGGNLLLAETDAQAERLAAFVRVQHKKGFADVRLIDRAEIRQLAAGVAPHIVAGSYSPIDGQADPVATTRAFASAAQRYGATYVVGTACHALVAIGPRVVGAMTPNDRVEAEHVILAAGAWSDALALTIGLRLPIKVEALQILRSTPAPLNSLGPVLSAMDRALSLKQIHDGAFLLGGGWPGDIRAGGSEYLVRRESVEGNWREACAVFPAVALQRIERSWCGLEATSADGIPLVGPVPSRPGLTVALGFSGHGFAIAPAVGRALADQLEGKPVPELEDLRYSRARST
jgi:sarcosine oxidase subunit beta